VPRTSAVVPGQADAEPVAIPASYTNMVSYTSNQGDTCEVVESRMKIMGLYRHRVQRKPVGGLQVGRRLKIATKEVFEIFRTGRSKSMYVVAGSVSIV